MDMNIDNKIFMDKEDSKFLNIYRYLFFSYFLILVLTLNYDKINEREIYYYFNIFYNKINYLKSKIVRYYNSYKSINNEIKNKEISSVKDENKREEKKQEKYEDKYLKKYKSLENKIMTYFNYPNEENELKEQIKINREESRRKNMENIQFMIETTKSELDEFNEKKDSKEYLVNFFRGDNDIHYENNELEDFYNDIIEKNEIEEYIKTSEQTITDLKNELSELENTKYTDEDIHKDVIEIVTNRQLQNLVNNYVIEMTPLGNVAMRYNSEKGSFEYFSNNSIPYRYLEPVGRKYVTTYKCKSIFIDIEEELKHAEEKANEEKNKKEQKEKEENKKSNMFAKLKSYNKNISKDNSRPQHNNIPVPSNLKSLVPTSPEKLLLKENANRYTWEGRYSDFSPLKKIDKKLVDKKYKMTFSDFKKMQLEKQNK